MNFSNLWDTLSIFSFFLLDRSNTSYIFLLKIPDPQRFIDRCAIHPSRSCLVKLRSLREERSCATFSFRSNFFPVFWRVHDAITPDYLANDSENGLAKKAISIRLPSEKKEKRKGKRETVERARKRARYYHEQSRTNPGYLLLPGLPLNLPSPLLAGRLPTILYVVHFREADRSLAGRAFSLHDLAVHLCKRKIDRDICFIFCEWENQRSPRLLIVL